MEVGRRISGNTFTEPGMHLTGMVLGWTVLVLSDRKRSDGGRLGIRRRNLVLSTAGKRSDGGRMETDRRNVVLPAAGKRSDGRRLGIRRRNMVLSAAG